MLGVKKVTKKYDVIIVGSGPAGIFAALEITQASDLSLLLIEKGKDLGGTDLSLAEVPANPVSPVLPVIWSAGWVGPVLSATASSP